MAFVMSKDLPVIQRGMLVSMTIDFLQMIAFTLNVAPEFPWADVDAVRPFSQFLSFITTDTIDSTHATEAFLIMLGVAAGWTALLLALAASVAYSFVADLPQNVIILRLLRSTATLSTTVLFLPFTSVLMRGLACPSEYDGWMDTGWSCDGVPRIVVAILLVVLLVCFSGLALFVASVFIDRSPTSRSWAARSNGRVDVILLLLKLALGFIYNVLDRFLLGSWILTVLLVMAGVLWFYLFAVRAPLTHPVVNSLAAGFATGFTWTAVALGLAQVWPADAPDRVYITTVAFIALGSVATYVHSRRVARKDLADCHSLYEVDLWCRTRLQRYAEISQDFGDAGHANATDDDDLAADIEDDDDDNEMNGVHPMGADEMDDSASDVSPTHTHVSPDHHRHHRHAPAQDEQPPAAEAANEAAEADELLSASKPAEAYLDEAERGYRYLMEHYGEHELAFVLAAVFFRDHWPFLFNEAVALARVQRRSPGPDIRFYIYQRSRQLRESDKSGMSPIDRVMFDQDWKEVTRLRTETTRETLNLWELLSERKPDLYELQLVGVELQRKIARIEYLFRHLLSLNSDSTGVLRAYATHLIEFQNEPNRAQELLNKADRLEEVNSKEKNQTMRHIYMGAKTRRAATTADLMDESSAVITISADNANMAEILFVSPAACRVFGYSSAQLLGHNVNSIVPPPIRAVHDALLRRFGRKKTSHIVNFSRVVLGQHRDGSIFPMWLGVLEAPPDGETFQPRFTAVVQKIQTEENHIIFSGPEKSFRLYAASHGSIQLLGLDPSAISTSHVSMLQFFPSLAPGFRSSRVELDSGQMAHLKAMPSMADLAKTLEAAQSGQPGSARGVPLESSFRQMMAQISGNAGGRHGETGPSRDPTHSSTNPQRRDRWSRPRTGHSHGAGGSGADVLGPVLRMERGGSFRSGTRLGEPTGPVARVRPLLKLFRTGFVPAHRTVEGDKLLVGSIQKLLFPGVPLFYILRWMRVDQEAGGFFGPAATRMETLNDSSAASSGSSAAASVDSTKPALDAQEHHVPATSQRKQEDGAGWKKTAPASQQHDPLAMAAAGIDQEDDAWDLEGALQRIEEDSSREERSRATHTKTDGDESSRRYVPDVPNGGFTPNSRSEDPQKALLDHTDALDERPPGKDATSNDVSRPWWDGHDTLDQGTLSARWQRKDTATGTDSNTSARHGFDSSRMDTSRQHHTWDQKVSAGAAATNPPMEVGAGAIMEPLSAHRRAPSASRRGKGGAGAGTPSGVRSGAPSGRGSQHVTIQSSRVHSPGVSGHGPSLEGFGYSKAVGGGGGDQGSVGSSASQSTQLMRAMAALSRTTEPEAVHVRWMLVVLVAAFVLMGLGATLWMENSVERIQRRSEGLYLAGQRMSLAQEAITWVEAARVLGQGVSMHRTLSTVQGALADTAEELEDTQETLFLAGQSGGGAGFHFELNEEIDARGVEDAVEGDEFVERRVTVVELTSSLISTMKRIAREDPFRVTPTSANARLVWFNQDRWLDAMNTSSRLRHEEFMDLFPELQLQLLVGGGISFVLVMAVSLTVFISAARSVGSRTEEVLELFLLVPQRVARVMREKTTAQLQRVILNEESLLGDDEAADAGAGGRPTANAGGEDLDEEDRLFVEEEEAGMRLTKAIRQATRRQGRASGRRASISRASLGPPEEEEGASMSVTRREADNSSHFVLMTTCKFITPLVLVLAWFVTILVVELELRSASQEQVHRMVAVGGGRWHGAAWSQDISRLLFAASTDELDTWGTRAQRNDEMLRRSLSLALSGGDTRGPDGVAVDIAPLDDQSLESYQLLANDACRSSDEESACRQLQSGVLTDGVLSASSTMLDFGRQLVSWGTRNSTFRAQGSRLASIADARRLFRRATELEEPHMRQALRRAAGSLHDGVQSRLGSTSNGLTTFTWSFLAVFTILIAVFHHPTVNAMVTPLRSARGVVRLLPTELIDGLPELRREVQRVATRTQAATGSKRRRGRGCVRNLCRCCRSRTVRPESHQAVHTIPTAEPTTGNGN